MNIFLLRIYIHYKIFIHEKFLENYNDKLHENLLRPGVIYTGARWLNNTVQVRRAGADLSSWKRNTMYLPVYVGYIFQKHSVFTSLRTVHFPETPCIYQFT